MGAPSSGVSPQIVSSPAKHDWNNKPGVILEEAKMKPQHEWMNEFTRTDITSLEPALKIGILGTVTPDGLPHLTMISTLKASSPTQLSFGQFIEGRSKDYLRQNPKAGWLVMTLDRQIWRGTASFTHTARSGRGLRFLQQHAAVPLQRLFRHPHRLLPGPGRPSPGKIASADERGGAGCHQDHAGAHACQGENRPRWRRRRVVGAEPLDDRHPEQAGQPEIPRLHRGGWLPGGDPVHPGAGSRYDSGSIFSASVFGAELEAHPEWALRWRYSACRWTWKMSCCAAALRGLRRVGGLRAARCRWTGSTIPCRRCPGRSSRRCQSKRSPSFRRQNPQNLIAGPPAARCAWALYGLTPAPHHV